MPIAHRPVIQTRKHPARGAHPEKIIQELPLPPYRGPVNPPAPQHEKHRSQGKLKSQRSSLRHAARARKGTGYFTRVVAEAVTSGGTALGVDPSREVIARARHVTHLTNCTFSEGTAEALAAADGSHDVVVSSLMIHHLPEPLRPQAIREMFRVLRPGGWVLIADFRPPASRIGRRLIAPLTSTAMENNPVHLLEPMVREAGFGQVRTGDVHPWIRYVQAVKPASAP